MRATLRIVLYLLFFVHAAALIAGAWAWHRRPDLLNSVLAWPPAHEERVVWIAAIVGGVIVACQTYLTLRWLQIHRRAREVSYTTDNGSVSVKLVAIEEALTRALENEGFVKRATVRVYEDRVKRQLVIDAVMTLWEVPNVTERNRYCQQLLRRRFAELMPERTQVQVNLTVHRLVPKREERRTEHKAAEPVAAVADVPEEATGAIVAAPAVDAREPETVAEPSEEDLYVGPTYPVEDDEEAAQNYLGRPLPVTRKDLVKGKQP